VAALEALEPDGRAEWLEPPVGENNFLTPAMDAGIKIAAYFRPWYWNGRAQPLPYAEALRLRLWPGDPTYAGTTINASLAVYQDRPYAAVNNGSGATPCQASSLGGNIDVTCDSRLAGQLVVQEFNWTGWSVRVDGQPATLAAAEWLTTAAPAGRHTFSFRYRPWDVPLGAGVTLLGLAAAVVIWRRAGRKADLTLPAPLFPA